MTIRVRALSPEEVGPLVELAHSRKRGAGLVRRAQIVLHAVEERLSAPEIATRMGLCGETVRFWIKRFNACGLKGLEEDMRSWRHTCSAADTSVLKCPPTTIPSPPAGLRQAAPVQRAQ